MKYILFDLDGTLADSSEGIVNCFEYAFRRMGAAPPPRAKLRACIGPPLLDSFRTFCGGDEAEARQVCAELGALLRRSEDWTLTAISSRRDFEKAFGRRRTKRRRVYNGRIECEILSFDPKSEHVAKERRSPRPGPKR